MTTAEHRALGTQLRSMLLEAYRVRGNDFGLGLARRCAWEIGDVVAEIHGRERAGEVLDSVSNAVLQDAMPAPPNRVEYEPPPGMMAITIPRTDAEADAMIAWIKALRATVPQPAKPVVTKRLTRNRRGAGGK